MQVSDPGRQSGRTWRQLEALPDGSIFLVHQEQMANYCRALLHRMGRDPRAIRFATPYNFQRFEGATAPKVDVDHAYWGARLPRASEAYHFLQYCTRPPLAQPDDYRMTEERPGLVAARLRR